MNCINCGNALPESAKFCNNCGTPRQILQSAPTQQPQTAYQQPSGFGQQLYVQAPPNNSAFVKKRKLPLIIGAIGILLVLIIIIAIVASNGSDNSYSPSYSRDNDIYNSERTTERATERTTERTTESIKTIKFRLYNNTNGTVTGIYINGESIFSGSIASGGSYVASFWCNTDIFDISDIPVQLDIYGTLTEATYSASWDVNFTGVTGLNIEESSLYEYTLTYIY